MEEKNAVITATAKETQVNYKGIKTMPFIIGNEAFEKLGAWGTTSNLIVYFTTVFNMKRVNAAILIDAYKGTSFVTPLVGGFLADAYFGRYMTLGFASLASFLGMILLMLTAAISKLHPPNCGTQKNELCVQATTPQWTFMACALGFLVIGAGGIRPCNMAFGADQFNPKTDTGKRSIISFINWYFFVLSSCTLISLTVIIYVQSNVSWTVGLALPPCLMLIACILYFMGSTIYVKVKPEGSPFTRFIQVIVAATRKRCLAQLDNPEIALFNYIDPNSINSKLQRTDQFRIFDKAAIISDVDQIKADGTSANPWRLCSMQQVEELKCLIRVLPIWVSSAIFHITVTQQHSYAVYQALQSDRHLGTKNFQVPAASYIVFSWLTIVIWIPIYDRLIVPPLRKLTGQEGGITLLQKMGIGTFISIITMFVSALVEQRRRNFALTYPTLGIAKGGGAVSSMSAHWLILQLSINGLSEAFNHIGQLEFYYNQFPENMRSVAVSFFFLGFAVGSYISSFMVSIVHRTTEGNITGNWLPEDLNKGRLDYFYYMITVMNIVNFGYFLVCARWYRYKGSGTATKEAASKNIKDAEKPPPKGIDL
ncbi:protein NRT1/ PTR FAMILY 2.11-like isoform X1 [Papaver somniferum]|uniref:protein NRT1/ PTR FAMILY 2.11-like isoform X1 n=1 Tax=Papaver somniferum TaxID=3469 RepID=UPI000E6FC5F8|nr:protein NRT1/ PTR FAMILY 2.11-like isoform X1 [Papaver somniferum]